MIKNLLASLALGLISCAISRFSPEFSRDEKQTKGQKLSRSIRNKDAEEFLYSCANQPSKVLFNGGKR